MKIWQAVGCGVVAIVAFVGLIVSVVFWATGGITDAADDFFAAANEGNYERAYGLTSQQLQGQIDAPGLEAFLIENGLDEVTETSWSSRSIQNDTGELEGTVTTQSGGTIPITMELIQEGEDWRIKFIDVGNAGVRSGGGAAMVVPSPEAQAELVQATTMGFYNALGAEDFTEFKDQLEGAFGQMRPLHGQMNGFSGDELNFEPATELNDAGLLELSGNYTSDEGILEFTYFFYGEGNDPLLLGEMDVEWK